MIKNNWLEFYPKFSNVTVRVSPASYFDSRWFINICLGWGHFYIHLPFRSKIDDCEYPEYGFYWYGEKGCNSIWLCWGYKKKCIYMPWALDWVRTSKLLNDNNWAHDTKKSRKDFWQDEWKDKIAYEKHPYTYTLKSGEVQHCMATINVEEREWRPRWFKWTTLFRKVRKSIGIEFNHEVGERAGSWKGGVLGCGYDMLANETPLQTLRRMEKERVFR